MRVASWKFAVPASVAGLVCAAVLAGGRGAGALEPGLGRIDFPTSGSIAAQKLFVRGVLLLHSFEYDDAREAFQEAQKADPSFAMAYWGEAMTDNHPIWMEQDRDAALRALARLAPTPEARAAKAPTPREKDYLRAVEALYGSGNKDERDRAYAEEMRRLSEKCPSDDEAATFRALALLGTCHQGRDFRVYMQAAGILEQVYQRKPEHPGAVHYLIHCYDDPVHAPLGVRPARAYARIAAAASHAQHMPSHIFLALGLWEETAASNAAAWAVSVERARRKGLGPDARNYHALYWLEYADLQRGRVADARGLVAEMESAARQSGSVRAKTHLARMRAVQIVETGITPPDGPTSASGAAAAAEAFARGLTAWTRRDPRTLRAALAAMGEGGEASTDVLRQELRGLLALQEARPEEGIAILRAAADAEDRMSFEFGPPEIVKPSHELLGEVLLQAGRAGEAAAEFEKSLARAPGRALSLRGLAEAARRSGNDAVAARAEGEYRNVRRRADPAPPPGR